MHRSISWQVQLCNVRTKMGTETRPCKNQIEHTDQYIHVCYPVSSGGESMEQENHSCLHRKEETKTLFSPGKINTQN